MGLFVSEYVLLRFCGFSCLFMFPFAFLWILIVFMGLMGPFEFLFVLPDSNGSLWVLLGLYSTLWYLIGLYVSI